MIDRIFGIDARSLAFFRIGLSLVLLAELAERMRYLTAFYTDGGVMPRSFFIEQVQSPWSFSLHLASGSSFFQAFLFTVALLVAVALLLGYKTRLATVLSWLLLSSLMVRNPEVSSAGDKLLLLLLFWSLFLPLGLQWSVDRARAEKHVILPGRVLSMGTVAVLVQAALVYLFTWSLKTGEAWRDGSAVWLALNWDQGTTALGRAMLQFPELLQLATHSVAWFELLGPLLLFLPFFTPLIRLIMVPLFWLLHLSFVFIMTLGTFPFVSIVSVIPFLPARFWELLPFRLPSRFGLFGVVGAMRARAQARGWFQPQPLRWQLPLVGQVVAGLLLVYVVIWNLAGVWDFRAPLRPVAHTLQIHQKWSMFAPYPTLGDGWYVVPGTLVSGEEVDVFRAVISGLGEEFSWDKPALVSKTFPDVQWRKYLGNLRAAKDPERYHHFAAYLKRTWNASQPPERYLESLDIYYVLEHTERLAFPPQRLRLWRHHFTN